MLDSTFVRLMAFEEELPDNVKIEIIAVDDGSTDSSLTKILENQKKFPGKIRAVRLSRNFGANNASQAGLDIAKGDCVANIPQDLQEPPELFLRMFQGWQEGVKVNIGFRESRNEPFLKKTIATCYHALFRYLVLPDYPKGGLCTFLIDRQVADELRRRPDVQMDVPTKLFMMGYSHHLHAYHRDFPPPGIKSNWTVGKNIKLVIDNFISFSYLPVRLMSAVGLVTAATSFIFAAYIFMGKLTGWYPINQPPGWATIVILLSFLSGLIMTMLGIIGEYLWRILDAVRRHPVYLIDEIYEELNVDSEQS